MTPISDVFCLVIGVTIAPFSVYAMLTGLVESETPALPWTAIHFAAIVRSKML